MVTSAIAPRSEIPTQTRPRMTVFMAAEIIVAGFPLGRNSRRTVPDRILVPVQTRAGIPEFPDTPSPPAGTQFRSTSYRCSVAFGAGLGVGLAAVAVRDPPPTCRMVILLIFTGSSGRSF